MQLRYLRVNGFYQLLKPFSLRARAKRMRDFLRITRLQPWARVLDLGGAPAIWQDVSIPLDITLLNLPGHLERADETHHRFTYVEGDACHVSQFSDLEFDLVFSNSVIEHVGSSDNMRAFAGEVLRLGRSHWVQTPSRWFPIEAHSGMPFWWFYPPQMREAFLRHWHPRLPAWTEMVRTTRVLTSSQLQELFPCSRLVVERCLGLPKSYTVCRVGGPADHSL